MPLILGVDPGRSGAIALVDTASRKVLNLLDVPTLAMGGWRLVDGAAVASWLGRNPAPSTLPWWTRAHAAGA